MGTTGQSITLANSIIGVGILAMPFCFQQCGVLLATLILMFMGLISRLCCYFLLKSAIITRRRNFEFLAFHVFGPAGKMAVEMGIIGFLMGTCIAYFVVVGDLGPQIIAKMLNINQSDILRTSIMVVVSLVCILPLGLLRNVDSLSNVSAATIAFYFCLVIKVIAEATSQLFTTDWYNHMELWKPSGVLQCVPIFSMALFCQTQLFEIFESMPSVSLEKMCVVTKNAINICAAVYMTLGMFGYIAFSSQEISGNILMSLSPTWASDVIKLGFVMSLAFSFPLIIFPCRASLYSFLYRKAHTSQHDHTSQIPVTTFRLITVGIVGAALVVSLLLPNVELVLGLLGSTVGVLVCVVFPAACFLNVTFKDTNERLLAKFIVVLGLFILVLGTFANLQAAENTRDKYDERQITKERIDKIVEDFFNHQQESEAVVKKPNLEVKKPYTNKIVETDIIKDSEVQPPNPVPPEAQPVNDPGLKPLEEKNDKPKEILPNTKEEILNEETESHPRNLKLKTNGQSVDEAIKVPNEVKEANEGVENNIDIKQEKISNSQEKIDMLKQQQLVETIKQHGEEQKELLNEQKNILKEILKTKQELENKKEEETNEAKKIAVESIQKIANMAIQKIGGVTEKPLDKKPDPIQNIADAAVNQIAKKAAETLNVIKQKDIPSDSLKQPDTISNGENNLNKNAEDERGPINIEKPAKNQNVGVDEGKPNSVLNNQESNSLVLDKVNKALNDIKRKRENLANRKLQDTKLKPAEPLIEKEPNVLKLKENLTRLHEKPKSKERIEINQKEPIPLILNPQENNLNKVVSNNADSAKSQNDNKINNIGEDKIVDRQKREVVDCTETTLLQPEDKQICENLVNKPKTDTADILSKVDLNDALSNKLPLDILYVHHNIRSLKSFSEDKKR